MKLSVWFLNENPAFILNFCHYYSTLLLKFLLGHEVRILFCIQGASSYKQRYNINTVRIFQLILVQIELVAIGQMVNILVYFAINFRLDFKCIEFWTHRQTDRQTERDRLTTLHGGAVVCFSCLLLIYMYLHYLLPK